MRRCLINLVSHTDCSEQRVKLENIISVWKHNGFSLGAVGVVYKQHHCNFIRLYDNIFHFLCSTYD